MLAGLLLAMFISFFHLGQVQRARYALNNLQDSWISREILSLALFSLSLFFLLLGRRYLQVKQGILSALFLFSLLSAVALMFVMIKLYMIPAVVTWNTWYTPFSFTLTSLILGIGAILGYRMTFQKQVHQSQPFLAILILLLLLEAMISGLNQYRLSQLSMIHYNPVVLGHVHGNLTLVRISLILAALVLLVLFQHRIKVLADRSASSLLPGLALLLILIEQVVGRCLFFASYIKLGI
jgi:DMSO reductase anchor subunit